MQVYEIRYTSQFRYPQPVWDSHNVLRACPCSDERQMMLMYRVALDPSARVVSYTDYFGTRVDLFGVAAPHRSLEVTAETRVAVYDGGRLEPPAASCALGDPVFTAEHWEYLMPSAHVELGEGVAREAREAAGGACGDAAALGVALSAHVQKSFRYAPGSTRIGIDVAELQRSRRGVSQDFAHYLIALCRSLGLPARYVSGYVFSDDEGDDPPAAGADVPVQTHAWVEVAIPGAGWWPLDPSQRMDGVRHVKIGHGRDYHDVMPLRGLYHGPFSHELEVLVRVKRLAAP